MENDYRVGAACLILLGMIVMGLCYYLAPRPGRFTREVSVEEGDTSYVSIFDTATGKQYIRKLTQKMDESYEIDIPSAAKVQHKEARNRMGADAEEMPSLID